MNYIFHSFPISNAEYEILNKEFGDLANYQAWQLYKKNNRNNHTDDQEDIVQDIRISMLTAGSYHKRQVYIKRCLKLCERHAKDQFIKSIVDELQFLWDNKTRHGANRQKFGPYQEELLTKLVKIIVPKKERPSKTAPLQVDSTFRTYCKSISWNKLKAMGKKITREKSIRSGQVSLSEYSYLGSGK